MWLRFFTTDEDFLAACGPGLKSEVDGLIVAGVHHPKLMPKFADLERDNMPVISLFNDLSESDRKALANVEGNYERQGYLATRHLLEKGCRRLACFDTVEHRTAGFVRAHREAKVKYDPRLLIPTTKSFLRENTRESIAKLLGLDVPFDGIVCQADVQAIAVINELVRRGINVPGSVKITGVDNSPAAEDCFVPITSVTSEMKRAGLKAVEMLLRKIEGHPVKSAVIDPGLVVRISSGAPQSKYTESSDLK